jgi:hypothetical protein
MNTERLQAIAVAGLDELKVTKSEETLKQLIGALQNAVNQPNAPQFQQQISDFRAALKESLLTAPSNSFGPAWKQALKELGLQEFLGKKLQARIEEIFSRNQITTSIAFTDIQKIYKQLTNHRVALELLNLEGEPILILPESQGDHKDKKERSKGGGQETENQG